MRQVLRVAGHVGTVVLFLLVWVGSASAALRYGERVVTIVAAQKVNLRAMPEMSPETVIAQVSGGAQLRLVETAKDWFKVCLPDGEIAWLSAALGREDVARDLVQVKVSMARVRENIGVKNPVVSKAPQGTFLRPLEVKDKWVRVRLPDDQEGWIRGDLLGVHRVAREDETLEESSTHTLLLLASVGSGVSALSFMLVMTSVFRRKRRQARASYY